MQTSYNTKMHTVDKYGWTILEGDTGYSLPESVRTSMVAQGPVEKYVKEKKVAVEIGVYYGFTTRWLSGIFDVVHTFDLKNAVLECFEINMQKFKRRFGRIKSFSGEVKHHRTILTNRI